jgi:sulfopyruvate decarboxylase TPP-binding subunit
MHECKDASMTAAGNVKRYAFLQALAARAGDALVVTNLANTATEWFSVRPSDANLYAVGMGMVTSYALGLALSLPKQDVIALDGDGGIFFDPSVFGVIAAQAAANLTVIVFDNGGYVSTGRLPAVGSLSSSGVDLEILARAYGIRDIATVADVDGFVGVLDRPASDAPRVIVVKTSVEQQFVGALPIDLKENKYRFARHIEQSHGAKIIKPSAKEHGARPSADPDLRATGQSGFGQVLYEGLRENGVNFAIGLPCSGFSTAQELLLKDDDFDYVSVPHEGTGLGMCAGAWLAGRRPAALIENFGLFASVYHLLRGHMSYGIPTLMITEFRGDTGDQEFFAEGGELTLDLLKAMRINYRVVDDLNGLKPAIRDALRWMDGCLRPFALVPTFNLTRLKS